MASVGSNFLWTSTWRIPLPPPSTGICLSLTPLPPCGRHKWMAPCADHMHSGIRGDQQGENWPPELKCLRYETFNILDAMHGWCMLPLYIVNLLQTVYIGPTTENERFSKVAIGTNKTTRTPSRRVKSWAEQIPDDRCLLGPETRDTTT